MRCATALLALLAFTRSPVAPAADLAFHAAPTNGFFTFDTGALRGTVRASGRSQGLVECVHLESGTPVARGGPLPGLLSLYRVFSTDTRYGDAARDWPTEPVVKPDGALGVRWPAAPEHPLEMTGVYRWARPDALDLEITVTPQTALPRFELFLSSYFQPEFRAAVHARAGFHGGGEPAMVAADVNPLVDGTYLLFPRDRAALQMVFDRRWELPPHPVQWSVTRQFASPLILRRHAPSRVTALLLAPPEDCFALATAYNKTPPDGVADHWSLYLSLFGRDLAAGETARARTRLVIGRDLTDARAVELQQEYLRELQGK